MKSLPRKYVISLAVVWCSTLLLLGVAYFLLIRPQSINVQETKNQLSLSEQDYDAAQQARNEQSKTKLQNKLQDAEELLASVSVTSENAAALIFEISQTARKLQVQEFTSKRNDTTSCEIIEGCKNLGRIGLDVSFVADFPQFAKFVNMLERHKPYVFVETFDVDRGKKATEKPKIKMKLTFFVDKEFTQKKT